jgi:hypothetical protein
MTMLTIGVAVLLKVYAHCIRTWPGDRPSGQV